MDRHSGSTSSHIFTIDFSRGIHPDEAVKSCVNAYLHNTDAKIGYVIACGDSPEQEFETAYPLLIHTNKPLREYNRSLRRILERRGLRMIDFRILGYRKTVTHIYHRELLDEHLRGLQDQGVEYITVPVQQLLDAQKHIGLLDALREHSAPNHSARSAAHPFVASDSTAANEDRSAAQNYHGGFWKRLWNYLGLNNRPTPIKE